MRFNRLAVLFLLVVILGVSCASMGNPTEVYDTNLLLQDFNQFRNIIDNKTVGLFCDRVELESMLDQAEARINNQMSELEFYRLLAPIVARLKCGHSFLSVSEATEDFMRNQGEFFPLTVRIIDNKLYVISDPYSTGVVPGTEIISINGESAKSVIETIINNMPTDGDDTGRPRYDAERWFASMYYVYIENPELFNLELADYLDGSLYKASIPAIQDSALAKTSMGIVHDTVNSPWLMSIKEDYALARIPTFAYSNQQEFETELNAFFKDIKETNTEVLILDLRGNYGGSPQPTAELFKYLINKPLPFFSEDNPFYLFKWKNPIEPAQNFFEGRLYVLMDEAGFSMNSFLLSLLKYHNIGVLYGAPSSGGFMCSDASLNEVLNNTGLRVRYSTEVFSTEVYGLQKGIGIKPDHHIIYNIEDYISGADTVLTAVFKDADINY